MTTKTIDRRELLRTLGLTLAAVPFTRLLGCAEVTAGGTTSSLGSATDGGSTGDAASATDAATTADAGGWATGGTASMTGKASYPNPFTTPSSCSATGALTEGPCYDSASEAIEDISYGQNGLPMRMLLRVLDASCNPVAGATVEVWHVAPTGKYSGDDTAHENVSFCTGDDATYTSALFFRGKQTTDATGVVAFDTCFPGWYSGRTIHVHFTVTSAGTSFTSQFVFEDALDDAIVATQPVYDARGSRDTTNATDTVVSATDYAQYVFSTQRMSDGAMLAWRDIVL
jgi:protocatechuate 3,4-dioxygenase beta subunit